MSTNVGNDSISNSNRFNTVSEVNSFINTFNVSEDKNKGKLAGRTFTYRDTNNLEKSISLNNVFNQVFQSAHSLAMNLERMQEKIQKRMKKLKIFNEDERRRLNVMIDGAQNIIGSYDIILKYPNISKKQWEEAIQCLSEWVEFEHPLALEKFGKFCAQWDKEIQEKYNVIANYPKNNISKEKWEGAIQSLGKWAELGHPLAFKLFSDICEDWNIKGLVNCPNKALVVKIWTNLVKNSQKIKTQRPLFREIVSSKLPDSTEDKEKMSKEKMRKNFGQKFKEAACIIEAGAIIIQQAFSDSKERSEYNGKLSSLREELYKLEYEFDHGGESLLNEIKNKQEQIKKLKQAFSDTNERSKYNRKLSSLREELYKLKYDFDHGGDFSLLNEIENKQEQIKKLKEENEHIEMENICLNEYSKLYKDNPMKKFVKLSEARDDSLDVWVFSHQENLLLARQSAENIKKDTKRYNGLFKQFRLRLTAYKKEMDEMMAPEGIMKVGRARIIESYASKVSAECFKINDVLEKNYKQYEDLAKQIGSKFATDPYFTKDHENYLDVSELLAELNEWWKLALSMTVIKKI